MSLLSLRPVLVSAASSSHLCRVLSVVPARTHTGYIPFEGRPFRVDREEFRFDQESMLLNLQPITKVTFSMDPFHPNVEPLRNTMVHMSLKRVRTTNPKCLFKTEILSDGSDPELKLELKGGKKVVFKAGTMSGSNMLHELNKIVLPLVEIEKEATVTKAAKVTAAGGGKGGKDSKGAAKKRR